RDPAAARVHAHPRLGAGPGRHALPAAGGAAPWRGRRPVPDLLGGHARAFGGRAHGRLRRHPGRRGRRVPALRRPGPRAGGGPERDRRRGHGPGGRGPQRGPDGRRRRTGRLVRALHHALPGGCRTRRGARARAARRRPRCAARRRPGAGAPPLGPGGLAPRPPRRPPVRLGPGLADAGGGRPPPGRRRDPRRGPVGGAVGGRSRLRGRAGGRGPLPARGRRGRGMSGPAPGEAVTDREGAVEATVRLVAGARRRIRILSRVLDPGLYDDPRVLEALRAFATGTTEAEVRLLVLDATAIQRAHAPLLALAQRLPSVFQFRELADPVDRARADAFLVT